MPASPALLERLRAGLRGHPEVRLALLFGSRARGRAGEGSDADLAVQGDAIDPFALGAELSLAAGMDVDVVELDKVGYPLLKALLRDGVVVHEGAPGAAARWRSRAILEVETDRPWFERMREAFLERLADG